MTATLPGELAALLAATDPDFGPPWHGWHALVRPVLADYLERTDQTLAALVRGLVTTPRTPTVKGRPASSMAPTVRLPPCEDRLDLGDVLVVGVKAGMYLTHDEPIFPHDREAIESGPPVELSLLINDDFGPGQKALDKILIPRHSTVTLDWSSYEGSVLEGPVTLALEDHRSPCVAVRVYFRRGGFAYQTTEVLAPRGRQERKLLLEELGRAIS